jgi:hypothetical protein
MTTLIHPQNRGITNFMGLDACRILNKYSTNVAFPFFPQHLLIAILGGINGEA